MAMNIKDTPYFALYGEIYRLHGKYLEPVAEFVVMGTVRR